MPEAAKKKGAKGAEAFVRHYVDLMNHAQATGDIAPMRNASLPACKSCAQVAKYVNRIYSSGGSISGGDLDVRKVYSVVFSPDTKRIAAVDVQLDTATGTVMEGGISKQGKASSSLVSFQITRKARWLVSSWNRVE